MRHRQLWAMVAFCVATYCVPSHAAVTQDSFLVRTTGDLVDLCTTAPTDPMGTAALNFCDGFGVGVYRVLDEMERVHKHRAFCMPDPMPTRNEALASFVQWAKANPEELALTPQDGISVFLAKQYPCAPKK